MRRLLLFLVFVIAAATVHAQTVSFPQLRLLEVARGFAVPVGMEFEPDGQHRLFVVEKAGRIRIVSGGSTLPTPFLDISSLVATGDEQGLLGMALPPGFGDKKYFYVNYTNRSGDTVIARFRVSASNANTADVASQQVILEIDQPASNHNGGQIRFGPDGYLYIGMGDGGGGNDAFHNGQNRQSLLGKILRIDVEGGAAPYAVPATNPFVGDSSYRPEIWALGVRNPWRFSFDRLTGDLWIADVGQDRWEEIDMHPAGNAGGENFGWPIMEGFQCLNGSNCDRTGLTLPVFQYQHLQGNISITGGFAYRGPSGGIPQGSYIYGDFGSGRMWWLWPVPGSPGQYVTLPLRDPGFNISTFGEDAEGNIFVADIGGGIIYRLDFITARSAAAGPYIQSIVPGSMASAYIEGLRDSAVSAPSMPLPFSLDGIELLLNNSPAPLYSVDKREIKFQAPFELPVNSQPSVTIRQNGQMVYEFKTTVDTLNIGVLPYEGTSEPALLHSADFSSIGNAHPAERGEYVTFYAAGLGSVNQPPPTGSAAPLDRLAPVLTLPQVTVGGVPCEVQFAGLAPGFVGIYQVNIRVAAAVASGPQELVVSGMQDGGIASSPPVLILIR